MKYGDYVFIRMDIAFLISFLELIIPVLQIIGTVWAFVSLAILISWYPVFHG